MQADSYIFSEGCYAVGMTAGRPARKPRPTFGERLAKARQEAGLTQAQLAERIGVSQRVVTYWEREPVALRAEQLAQVADALSVSADSLLGRKNGKRHTGGPAGKMRQLFQAASDLPRSQQQKVIDVLQPFITQHSK